MSRRVATAVTAVGLAFGAAACDVLPGQQVPERLPSGARIEGPIGEGRREVYVIRPQRPVRAVVVFGHGWGGYTPAHWLPWLDHLAAQGYAVIYPRYQLTAAWTSEVQPAVTDGWRNGLAAGFAALGARGVPVVAVGYSFGGGLVFYYGAYAKQWGLPEPVAIHSVFPVGLVAGLPPPLSDDVRVLVQVGDRDLIVGTRGGADWWAWLDGDRRRRGRYQVVRSTISFSASHLAPLGTDADARRIFWTPLDRTLAEVTRGAAGRRSAPVRVMAPNG